MKSHPYLLLIFLFFINGFFSQKEPSYAEIITGTAKNKVDENVTVYSFVFTENANANSQLQDTIGDLQHGNPNVNRILNIFKTSTEVLESSFDVATSIFTVVTNSTSDLSGVLAEINKQ